MTDNNVAIKRAVELHELNRKVKARIDFFDKQIKQYLQNAILKAFPCIYKVYIYEDSLIIRMPLQDKLRPKEIATIESLTGYKHLKFLSSSKEYVFSKKKLKMSGRERLDCYYEKERKIKKYIQQKGGYTIE